MLILFGFSLYGRITLAILALVIAGGACLASLLLQEVQLVGAIAASVVGLIMVAVFAIDVQLLLGGKRCEISPEEYVFAAVQLLVDIMLIFLLVLIIILLLGLSGGRGGSSSSGSCSGGGGGGSGGGGGGPGCSGGKRGREEEEAYELAARNAR